MKKVLLVIILVTVTSAASGFAGWKFSRLQTNEFVLPTPSPQPERVMDPYTIEALSNTNIRTGSIEILEILDESDNFTSYKFAFTFFPNPDKDYKKTTTGLINVPKSPRFLNNSYYPVVILIRGFVNQEIYQTGMGTKRAGEYFAENGFITIAPDFLGYADSDPESDNIFETRFQTYTTILSILKTLEQPETEADIMSETIEFPNHLFENLFLNIWAHSNGGQIALTALAATQKVYPTVLWAPVTKPFPYSVLYYTDSSPDGGKLIRRELAKLESLYEVSDYSFTNYLDNINSPIQIHQGTADNAIPFSWSQSFHKSLQSSYNSRDLDTAVELHLYSGADHNLNPDWQTAIERSLNFFLAN